MFDKINKIYNTAESIYEKIKEFFDQMKELNERQKEERIDLTKEIVDVMRNIDTLVEVMQEFDAVDQRYVKEQLVSEYSSVTSAYVDLDSYLEDYIEDVADDIVTSDISKSDEKTGFAYEEEVLLMIAFDGAQTILNYKDYEEAKDQGKTQKTWIAHIDSRTRRSHEALDGKTIPIDDTFDVGGVLMRYPHDWEYAGRSNKALRQLIRCRCQIRYR